MNKTWRSVALVFACVVGLSSASQAGDDLPSMDKIYQQGAEYMQLMRNCSDARKDGRHRDVLSYCTPLVKSNLEQIAKLKNRLPYDIKVHNADGILSDRSSIAVNGVFACEDLMGIIMSEASLGYLTQARRDVAFSADLIRQTKRSDIVEDPGANVKQRYDEVRELQAKLSKFLRK